MKVKALLASMIVFGVFIAIVVNGHGAAGSREGTSLPRAAIEQALGAKGSDIPGDVFMIGLPRSDIQVRVGNVTLSPAMALDSWVAFTPAGDQAMLMGDLVLTADEMWPVQSSIQRGGLDITAIHNTLLGETPDVYDLHISGQGDPAKMAGIVHDALIAGNVPINATSVSHDKAPAYPLATGQINSIIGADGKIDDGIIVYSLPIAEKVTENGMEIPSSLDVQTMIKFQPLPGNSAAVIGEFVLPGSEVNTVIHALNNNGIEVTAMHTHMLAEEPRLYYLHIWAVGDQITLAKGLREALDQKNTRARASFY